MKKKPAKSTRLENFRNKPVISIRKGLLIIEDCSCSKVALSVDSAKELHQLLPGLISILEPMCSGNGSFMFGEMP